MEETLSFDDVLIKPRKGIVTSRKDINISTNIGNLKLNMPLISLNMDTVTETDMAIAMARQGGIGMVHRFMTIEEQANIIKKVKRSMSLIIENPYHIDANKTALEAKDEMEEKGIGGLLVTDENKLVGIITTKDLVFQSDQTLVRDLMTKDLITANLGVTQEEAKNIMHKNRIEKLPVLDNGRLIGLISSKDIRKRETFTNSAVDSKGRLIVGAAVGVVGDYLERTKALIEAGADAINIDVAHGHSDLCINATKQIKEIAGDVTVISGNVATYEGFLALANAGADAIRCGVGNGTICLTRIVTGCGVPQISAITDCYRASKETNIPLISEGGTKNSGDVVKAIIAGASAVAIGSQFAGTDESPGKAILRNGRRFKLYRGSTSFEASIGRKIREKQNNVTEYMDEVVPEGVESYVPYKGSVNEIIHQLLGGLKSGLSYCGVNNLKDAIGLQNFIKITGMGMRESHAHDVDVIK